MIKKRIGVASRMQETKPLQWVFLIFSWRSIKLNFISPRGIPKNLPRWPRFAAVSCRRQLFLQK
jgi:hypothetical protein